MKKKIKVVDIKKLLSKEELEDYKKWMMSVKKTFVKK